MQIPRTPPKSSTSWRRNTQIHIRLITTALIEDATLPPDPHLVFFDRIIADILLLFTQEAPLDLRAWMLDTGDAFVLPLNPHQLTYVMLYPYSTTRRLCSAYVERKCTARFLFSRFCAFVKPRGELSPTQSFLSQETTCAKQLVLSNSVLGR